MIDTNKVTIGKEKVANRTLKLLHTVGVSIFVAVCMSGCVKDELHNTPHPDKGAVVITTDWSGRSSDAVVPGSYILRIGTQEQTVSEETNTFNFLFLPGEQDLLVYHQTEGITASGTTATVSTLADGTLEPMPGYLFSAARKLEIEKDNTLKVTVKMQQLIRSLTLTLKLKAGDEQHIGSTAATLTGVASAIDLTTRAITSTEGKTVIPAFTLGTDDSGMRAAARTRSTGQPLLSATIRLPGVIAGEKQVLTLNVTLTTGYVQTIVTDLTEMLNNFGANMAPLELDATLELPVDGQYGGTITGWDKKGDITVDAD